MEQFSRYFLDTVKNRYVKFDGRATRSEYWYFTLFYFILLITAILIDTYLINPMLGMTATEATQGGFLQAGIALALFLPSLGLAIRRLHDIGKSGWWILVGMIPVVGFFVLLYFFVTDSQPGSNLYGPNPKGT